MYNPSKSSCFSPFLNFFLSNDETNKSNKMKQIKFQILFFQMNFLYRCETNLKIKKMKINLYNIMYKSSESPCFPPFSKKSLCIGVTKIKY